MGYTCYFTVYCESLQGHVVLPFAPFVGLVIDYGGEFIVRRVTYDVCANCINILLERL